MSAAINTGGPAFPTLPEHGFNSGEPGMTLRDYFAAKAMAAFIGQHVDAGGDLHLATESYAVADAMLAARQGGAA